MPQVIPSEYLAARQLDVLPRPLAPPQPRYPESAPLVPGVVVLLLLIDELGMVTDARVLSAEPPGYFEEAALEAFRGALFHPGQREGRAVKSRLPVEVSFDPEPVAAVPR